MSNNPSESSSAPTTPNSGRLSDEELEQMGVDPDARGFIESWRAIRDDVVAMYYWAKRRLVRADKRSIGIVVLSVALLVVGFIALNGRSTTTDPIAPPEQPATATESPANGPQKHTVKNGEHLASIGKMYGISRLDMQKANPGINVDKLAIGQIVNIPVAQVATNNGN